MQSALVRNVEFSLLATAGLASIVVGFAAQKLLTGLIGRIQLSITQPIRIGDTVFIDRELGTVEKIHLTYVVLRLREQRMLVVPVARFLDTPFESWTLGAPDVIGSVLISVDFTTPVEAVRAELARACAEHEAWDQDVLARRHRRDGAYDDAAGARLLVGRGEELGALLRCPRAPDRFPGQARWWEPFAARSHCHCERVLSWAPGTAALRDRQKLSSRAGLDSRTQCGS